MWSFAKRYRPLLGLDITTSSVKLIELTMSGGQYRVESYAAEPTPHNAINEKAIVDAEAVGEAIRRAVKRSGGRISLLELADALRELPGVADAACVVFDNAGGVGIVAFVVTDRPFTALELRQGAGRRLPATAAASTITSATSR